MAINANALSKKTTPSGTDDLLLFDDSSNSGTKIDYDDLADAILNKLTSKTYANQVGGSSAATLLAQLATLNSNLTLQPVTITAGENVVLDTVFCYKVGRILMVDVKGHATADISNADFFIFDNATTRDAFTFPIGIGSAWSIASIGYGFASGSRIVGRCTSGNYFHIALTCAAG